MIDLKSLVELIESRTNTRVTCSKEFDFPDKIHIYIDVPGSARKEDIILALLKIIKSINVYAVYMEYNKLSSPSIYNINIFVDKSSEFDIENEKIINLLVLGYLLAHICVMENIKLSNDIRVRTGDGITFGIYSSDNNSFTAHFYMIAETEGTKIKDINTLSLSSVKNYKKLDTTIRKAAGILL